MQPERLVIPDRSQVPPNTDCKSRPHLGTDRAVPASAFCLCSVPSAVHSWFRSSGRPSRTLASPASASRWPRSDCLCLRSATATTNTECWYNVGVIRVELTPVRFHEGYWTCSLSLIPWKMVFFYFWLLFFLSCFTMNKGCIQLNVRLCQSNEQIGLMGHLPIWLKTFSCSLSTCRPLSAFVYSVLMKLNLEANWSNWSLTWLSFKGPKLHV